MNTEELKSVVEMISGLGDKAGDGLIWYLVFDLTATALSILVALTIVIALYKIATRAFDQNDAMENRDRKIQELRDESYALFDRLEGIHGLLEVDGVFRQSDKCINKMRNKIEELKRKWQWENQTTT